MSSHRRAALGAERELKMQLAWSSEEGNMSQQLASVLAADTALQSRDSAGLLRVRPPAVLMELVERFRVCWEMFPEIICIDRETRRVGFALELYGTHEPEDVDHHTQRCFHCQRVFAALHVIADWILPRERKASMYEAEVSSPSISRSLARSSPFRCHFYDPNRAPRGIRKSCTRLRNPMVKRVGRTS
jgi:hypothetical protein